MMVKQRIFRGLRTCVRKTKTTGAMNTCIMDVNIPTNMRIKIRAAIYGPTEM